LDTGIIHNEFPELIGEKSNFYEYRKTALRWIQLLSGKEWTDYNAHDPGVTILEALCYTLTEIDYKLDFSIEEILVSSSAEAPFKLRHNAFYLAEDILTSAPVTLNDYRRLLIDANEEINNAWIIPCKESNGKNKNFEILLLKRNQVVLPEKAIKATQALLDKFKAHGAKSMKVSVAAFEHIALNADIYIENEEHAENVLAELFFNLNETILNVNPNRQTYPELEEEGQSYTDIFDGPRMNNGIITAENLSESIANVSLIGIKKIIAATAGIKMIDNLSIKQEFESVHKAEDKIEFPKKINETYYVPYFSPMLKNDIRVFKDERKLEVNFQKVSEIIKHKALKTKKDYVLKNQHQSPTYKLNARDRNIHDYYSIKNDFPGVYGVKEKGFSLLQNQNPPQADQLKAYLQPFENLLENSFLRLALVRNLFSIHDRNTKNFKLPASGAMKKKDSLSALIQRDKFLTHLLARFDAYFNNNFEMQIDDDALIHLKKVILCKEKMLQDIDTITYNRPVHDHLNSNNISSLEKELYLRLSISEPPERPFYKAVSQLNYTITNVDDGEIATAHTMGNVAAMRNFDYEGEPIGYLSNGKDVLADLVKAGISKTSYKIIASQNNTKFLTTLTTQENPETLLSIRATKKEAHEQILILIEKFRMISEASEGFYMVDHSDLYNLNDESFSRFRMSFVFPSWSPRFQNRSFQKEVETIVAKLVPAHIYAHCIWLKLTEMTIFEDAYSEWHQAFTASGNQKNASGWQEELYGLSHKLTGFLKTYESKQH
jgi:hypothetical protein